MNATQQRSKLLEAALIEFEEWRHVFRFLVSFKSNSDFDGFFSGRDSRCGRSAVSFHTAQNRLVKKGQVKTIKNAAAEHSGVPAKRLGLISAMYFCLLSPLASAHGGVSVNIDNCRIPVDNRWVHFTAYTPEFTQDTEYCKSIPNVARTNLVFDYESRDLRNMTVEFEITKEPDGSRVFHQEPEMHSRGSVNAFVDFNAFGPGDYLAHVTLNNAGKKVDAHLPFAVGSAGGSAIVVWMAGFVTLAALFLIFRFGPKLNNFIGRISHAGTPPC